MHTTGILKLTFKITRKSSIIIYKGFQNSLFYEHYDKTPPIKMIPKPTVEKNGSKFQLKTASIYQNKVNITKNNLLSYL